MAGFQSLPAEIRIVIWQYSLPEPRNIVLSWSGKGFKVNASPPNTTQVCHESREETKVRFELSFAANGSHPYVWFDYLHDVLYITDEALERLSPDTICRVRNLRHFRNTSAMAQKCSS
jgi:hypothetical protein